MIPARPMDAYCWDSKGNSRSWSYTIRARMTAGLLNKAARGELALTLPVGLVRDALDQVHKDPNQELQDRLELIFTTFLRLRKAEQSAGVSQCP